MQYDDWLSSALVWVLLLVTNLGYLNSHRRAFDEHLLYHASRVFCVVTLYDLGAMCGSCSMDK